MIDLGRAPFRSDGVVFFPDHADPLRHHYLPEAPRLRRGAEGAPELALLKYRLDPVLHDALGAGLLSFTVDLSVEEEALATATARLRAANGSEGLLHISPVQAHAGRCDVVVIDTSSADGSVAEPSGSDTSFTVERIIGSSTVALYGTNAAAFQVVLTPEGVALVEGALSQGGLPIGVVYRLQTTGLRPALRARIRARWRDIYEFCENRFHGGKLLLAADLGPTAEELVRNELLTITVDELVPSSEQPEVYRQALAQAQRYVLEELFQPTLGQQPPPDEAGSDDPLDIVGGVLKDLVGIFSFTYSLKELSREELKTFDYALAVARAETMTLAPQGSLALLATDGDGAVADFASVIRVVEPAASAEMRFDVASLVDLTAEEIDHLEVWLRYGDEEQHSVLDATQPRTTFTFWFDAERGSEVVYGFEAHLRPADDGFGVVLRAPEEHTDRRVIRLDPGALYRHHRIRLVTQGVPFDRFPRIIVDLEARDAVLATTTTHTLELTEDAPEAEWSMRGLLEGRIDFRRRIRYVDADGLETVRDWETTLPGLVIVPHPMPDIQDLLLLASARFDIAVRRIIVELRPHAEPDAVVTRVLTADESTATWSWPVPPGTPSGYDYRLTVHETSGRIIEGAWQQGTPGKLIVGENGRIREVELIFVGADLNNLDVLALKVRFAFHDTVTGNETEAEMLVQDVTQPIRWSYAVGDPEHQAFTYQLTLIRRDGSSERRDPVETSDLLIVQPLP